MMAIDTEAQTDGMWHMTASLSRKLYSASFPTSFPLIIHSNLSIAHTLVDKGINRVEAAKSEGQQRNVRVKRDMTHFSQ